MMPESLLCKLNSLPLLRPIGLPLNLGPYVLIVLSGDMANIGQLIKANHGLAPEAVVMPDLGAPPAAIEIDTGAIMPVKAVSWLETAPQYAKVFLAPDNPNTLAAFLTAIARYLAMSQCSSVYISGVNPPAHSLRKAIPDFYERNKDRFEEIIDWFADQPSKDTYLGCIKAVSCGNAGYIPIAEHAEYFHPLVKPEPGDVVLDGGVSDMVGAQNDMASAVGAAGRIFGFEPMPKLFVKANRQLERLGNYTLICAGLALKDGWAFFEDMNDSSHILQTEQKSGPKVKCRLVSIDSFCRKNAIGHVDCIKLDVEGAELEALQGAREIIKRDHPKLIVCLYHKPQDLFEIPQLIKKIAPEYKFYLAHSSCQFMDTVLYCRL